jgi:hypothetical protein
LAVAQLGQARRRLRRHTQKEDVSVVSEAPFEKNKLETAD